jgi:hypothetical protein
LIAPNRPSTSAGLWPYPVSRQLLPAFRIADLPGRGFSTRSGRWIVTGWATLMLALNRNWWGDLPGTFTAVCCWIASWLRRAEILADFSCQMLVCCVVTWNGATLVLRRIVPPRMTAFRAKGSIRVM